MYWRAIGILTAGFWGLTLSAQTAPPQAPVVRAEVEAALRKLLTNSTGENTESCSIPLLAVPVAKNVEKMPTLRPRADNMDNMPLVKLPAPPCREEQR